MNTTNLLHAAALALICVALAGALLWLVTPAAEAAGADAGARPCSRLDWSDAQGHYPVPAHLWAVPGVDLDADDPCLPADVTYDVVSTLGPSIVQVGNVFDGETCRALIQAASAKMAPSLTITSDTGVHVADPARTSFTALLDDFTSPLVRGAMARLAAVMGTDPAYLETLQVVRYLPGQHFKPHHDFLNSAEVVAEVGQRCRTLFLYLNDREEGETGATTAFLRLGTELTAQVVPYGPGTGAGTFEGWAPAGSGFMWANIEPTGSRDWRTLHEGRPPTKGVKWGLNVWLRSKPNALAAAAFTPFLVGDLSIGPRA